MENFNYGIGNNLIADPSRTLSQGSLLNTRNNPTKVSVGTFNPNQVPPWDLPTPYQIPPLNFGSGPEFIRDYQEISAIGSRQVENGTRHSTSENPFMNISPLDYGKSPNFPGPTQVNYPQSMYDFKKNEQAVSNNFNKGLFQDANGRLFDRNNSQRQFYSVPNGDIPNNQKEFGTWLYGSDYVCKSGSIYSQYGVQYTDDSLTCNGYNVSVPTNQGLLNGNLMSSVAQ